MIKGCQKKIIFLKNTGCELFEEAYFIMKECTIDKGESDIVLEATKIVNCIKESCVIPKKRFFWQKGAFIFSLGTLLGFGVAALSYLIFA